MKSNIGIAPRPWHIEDNKMAHKRYIIDAKGKTVCIVDTDITPGIVADGIIEEMNKDVKNEVSLKYYLIIGSYINYPMGCCTSRGLVDVHEEEPDAKFYEITQVEYDNFSNQNYSKEVNWLSLAKSFEDLKN